MVAAVAVAALAGSMFFAPSSVATPPPAPPPPAPTNPSNAQLNAASADKNAAAAEVGRLGGEIAATQAELQRLQGVQELAEQRLAYAISQLREARAEAVAARQRVQAAAAAVVAARKRFVQYLQATYMGGDLSGTTGSLLTAPDPTALLDRGTLEQYQADKQIDAMGTLQRATVVKSNADAAARRAVRKQAAATKAAKAAKVAADQAVADAQAQEAALQATLVTKQQQFDAAQLQLATLNGQRAAYVVWQGKVAAYNVALAAWKAEQERLARIRAERIAAAARAQAAREAAARAAAAARHRGGGGSSSSVAAFVPNPGRSAPASGHWTRAEAQTAVRRAMSTLGTPYAWAGGDADGPTYGVCDVSNGAPNDCNVYGYDCSGLVMYAWGPYLNLAHFAATQYHQAGSYHPGAGNLRAGDLVFWSDTGRWQDIHHVAIYIGGGQIIEAPFSGGYVQIASLYEYGSDFFTTRPLT